MTTNRSLILYPHEVRAALRGELLLIVRPILHKHAFKTLNAGPGGGKVYQGPVNIPDNEVSEAISWLEQHSPFGVPGTRLVCKETWAICQDYDRMSPNLAYIAMNGDVRGCVDYAFDPQGAGWRGRWRSPATMPAWASRITLEVGSVEAGRLGDLTAQDARRSGFQVDDDVMALGALLADWQTRYQPKGMGIESKPWIWKCEVRRLEG